MFECRTCRWSREAESTCVYRNELTNTVGETAGITQDVASDPTVGANAAAAASKPSSAPLASQHNNQPASSVPSPPASPLPDFCTMCGQEIFCETCGNPTDFGFYLEVDDQDVDMTDARHEHQEPLSAARLTIDEDYDILDDESEPPTSYPEHKAHRANNG